MKNLAAITDPKDLVTKEYVDNAVAGGAGGTTPSVEDTGWTYMNSSLFNPYGGNTSLRLKYRKIGKVVNIQGILSPNTAGAIDADGKVVCTLPAGYRPACDIITLHQGSGSAVFISRVDGNGVVTIQRYRNTATSSATLAYPSVPTTAWLPINIVFFID